MEVVDADDNGVDGWSLKFLANYKFPSDADLTECVQVFLHGGKAI